MCDWWQIGCRVEEGIGGAIKDGLEGIANSVLQGVGRVMGEIATMWVKIHTPVLVGGGGDPARSPGDHESTTAAGFVNVLTWVQVFAFGVMVLCLIAAGLKLATSERGEARASLRGIGTVLIATIIVSAAVALTKGVLDPALFSRGSAPVAYIQGSLYWYMAGVTIIGIIVGAVRMAWSQRAEAGADLVRSLLTLIVVCAAGLSAVAALTAVSDEFAVWILEGSMACSIDAEGTCFTQAMGALTLGTSELGTFGSMLVISLGTLTLIVGIIQILLMVVRSAMLVLLAGILPISAAATNTETGKQMFQKTAGWMLGMILYKPAAAIVYATAFKLVGLGTFGDSGLTTTIVGLTMIVLAVIAMPALMSLIVPATASVASGSGMASAGAMAVSAMPSGSRPPSGSSRTTGGAAGVPDGASSGPSGSSDASASGSTLPGGSGNGGTGRRTGTPASAPSSSSGAGPAGAVGGAPTTGAAGAAGTAGPAGALGPAGMMLAAAQAAHSAASDSVQGGPSGSSN